MELVEQLVKELDEIYPDFNYQNIRNIINTTIKNIANHEDFVMEDVNMFTLNNIYSEMHNVCISYHICPFGSGLELHIKLKNKMMTIVNTELTNKVKFLNRNYEKIRSVTPIWLLSDNYFKSTTAKIAYQSDE